MRKIDDLTAEDFPGVDVITFAQWKGEYENANRNTSITLLVLVILNGILIATSGYVFWGGIILVIVIGGFWSKPNKLLKEMGLTSKAIRQARKRRNTANESSSDQSRNI